MRLTPVSLLIAGLLAAALPSTAIAQDRDQEWRFTIAPYFLAPYMDGTVAVRGIESDVSASPSDILDRLQFGFMLYAEAQRGDWAFSVDGLYMNLAQEAEVLPLKVGVKQGAVMFSAYRRIAPWAEAYIGGRLNILGSSLRSTGDRGLIDIDETKSWFDPYVGLRLTAPDTGRWRLAIAGDVGGFGVGSDIAWQIVPRVGYRASGLVLIAVAYRWLYMDYKTGDATNAFRYDMTTSGPELGVAFTF